VRPQGGEKVWEIGMRTLLKCLRRAKKGGERGMAEERGGTRVCHMWGGVTERGMRVQRRKSIAWSGQMKTLGPSGRNITQGGEKTR